MTKEIKATPEMEKFFKNLTEYKKWLKDNSKNELIKEAYSRFDKIFKTKDENK